MGDLTQKATVTIAGEFVSAHTSTGWRFQAGVAPFTMVFSVPNTIWGNKLEPLRGQPVTLKIVDSRGTVTEIEKLTILHQVASDKPSITSFIVSDRRWKWNRILVARTYNLSRRTGDIDVKGKVIPVEATGAQSFDAYDYAPYSLKFGDTVWTARQAVSDVLEHLVDDPADITFDGFSATDQFSLQNIVLRDQGDTALARMMAFVPGTDVWIDGKGKVRVINTLDLEAAERHRASLPPATWDGDKTVTVDRSQIRPKSVHVYYEREVEAVMHYSDQLGNATSTRPPRDQLYIENVIQTVDPVTTVTEYNPETDRDEQKDVPPGTYVEVGAWLDAMDKVKPVGALPWKFKTLQTHWLSGRLEGALMPTNIRGLGVVDTSNVVAAVSSLKQHFRQTFRISRRYMERLKDIKAIRVALLDPVTGMRMPSAVWGQMCLVPTDKGVLSVARTNPDAAGRWYNVDSVPTSGKKLVDQPPGPQALTFVDAETGIFKISTLSDPYGSYMSLVPSLVVGVNGKPDTPSFNLRDQDDKSMGSGMRLQNGTNQMFLSPTMEFKAMVTITPGAPNSKAAFHVEDIPALELAGQFAGKFRIQDGEGPPLEVYIPPSEVTARYAWSDDTVAESTIAQLIGLNSADPTQGGLVDDPKTPQNEALILSGFEFINHEREISKHAKAVAAEAMQAYADSIQGRAATIVPPGGLSLKGNMSGVTIEVASAPSGKVKAVHEYPGQSQPINRLALLPETARKVILGIVRFR